MNSTLEFMLMSKQNTARARRTLRKNSRTSRTLDSELHQLDKNQVKVQREIRQISHIKDIVQEHLKVPQIKRPRYITKNGCPKLLQHQYPRPNFHLPALGENERHKDAEMENIEVNESTCEEDASIGSEHKEERKTFLPSKGIEGNIGDNRETNVSEQLSLVSEERLSSQKSSISNRGYVSGKRRAAKRKHFETAKSQKGSKTHYYKTNEELRREVLIKSRFNQLGSKFVGTNIIRQNDVNKHLSNILITDLESPQNEDNLPEKARKSRTKHRTKNKPLERSAMTDLRRQRLQKQNAIDIESESPTITQTLNNKLERSSSFHRKQSNQSISVPNELVCNTLTRQRTFSLKQAFVTCQESQTDQKPYDDNGKQERRRRFCRLVDTIITQRRIVTAWETLVENVGDISLSDED